MTVRVLVVARGYPSYDAVGRGSFVADHVAALRGAGADVVVISFETVQGRGPLANRTTAAEAAERRWGVALGDPAALVVGSGFGAAGVPVARLPVTRTWGALDGSEATEMAARHRVPLLAFGRALADRGAAAGRPFHVVHAHNGLPDGVAAHALATSLEVPLVVTEHDSTLPGRLRHPAAAAAYRDLLGAATVVAVSEVLADRIAAALATTGVPAAVHGVLPNPVPLERFTAPRDGDPRDLDRLLWVGARAPHKGFETLLGAVALARERRPAIHLRAIGPSTAGDEERWQALIGELGIADAVSLEPAAPREVIAAAMREAGLFVHPSPFETFGMVAAEALASGLPIAATPSGGVEGIIDGDPARGEVAPDASPEALATAIERLRDRLEAIDRSALRASVEARFAPEVIARHTLRLYRQAGVAVDGSMAPTSGEPPTSAGDGSVPIVGAIVVATHPSAADRVATLPDGPLPVRLVRPIPVARSGHRAGWLGRLTGRSAERPDPGAATRDAIAAARRTLANEQPDGRIALVPADIEDVSTIVAALGGEAAPDVSAILAPGALRWLADLRDASRATVGR